MDIKVNEGRGSRYYDYPLWNRTKNAPYDYERRGLINHLLSSTIYNTKNTVTKFVLGFYESSLIFLMKYVDRLKHFKDPAWRNR